MYIKRTNICVSYFHVSEFDKLKQKTQVGYFAIYLLLELHDVMILYCFFVQFTTILWESNFM